MEGGAGGPVPESGQGRWAPGWGAGRRVCVKRLRGRHACAWGYRAESFGVSVGDRRRWRPSEAEDSAGADPEFATWRARSEAGSILLGQKEGMDPAGGWGHLRLPVPACPGYLAGAEPGCDSGEGSESPGHRGAALGRAGAAEWIGRFPHPTSVRFSRFLHCPLGPKSCRSSVPQVRWSHSVKEKSGTRFVAARRYFGCLESVGMAQAAQVFRPDIDLVKFS